MSRLLLALLALVATRATAAEPVKGYVDLHVHLAAHLTVPVYGRGPAAKEPARPTFDHAMRPQLFEAQLARSDTALYVSLAYANPFATVFETRASMRARIERQLAFVEQFCAERPDRYTLAKTPAEARAAMAAGRTVFVHGIEGATKIVATAEDAREWARRGVAVVTPVHLADNELGGSMCMSGSLALLNLPGCRRERVAPDRHGLTELGRTMIGAMMDAGIVMDLAHASPRSFGDLMTLARQRNVAPVYTHVKTRAVRDTPTALGDDDLRAIYDLGGLVGVTANLHDIEPTGPAAGCPGSIDDFRLHWDHIARVVGGAPVAWGSDFQGGVAHLRPKFGPKGCSPGGVDELDTLGLAHVGLTRQLFEHLARDGSDRAPLDASAERFLRIWEVARGERTRVED